MKKRLRDTDARVNSTFQLDAGGPHSLADHHQQSQSTHVVASTTCARPRYVIDFTGRTGGTPTMKMNFGGIVLAPRIGSAPQSVVRRVGSAAQVPGSPF